MAKAKRVLDIPSGNYNILEDYMNLSLIVKKVVARVFKLDSKPAMVQVISNASLKTRGLGTDPMESNFRPLLRVRY